MILQFFNKWKYLDTILTEILHFQFSFIVEGLMLNLNMNHKDFSHTK